MEHVRKSSPQLMWFKGQKIFASFADLVKVNTSPSLNDKNGQMKSTTSLT